MYAAIDLGSNSFHLLIAAYVDNKLQILERYSETVQLGQGLNGGGDIGDDAMARGLTCLANFKTSLSHYDIKAISCCGTNALRVASNRDVFLASARDIGFDIQVISGEREAELIYRGVTSRLAPNNEKHLVFDIGGGSTEFADGIDDLPRRVHSTKMGCVTWRDRFFCTGKIKKKYFDAAYEAAIEVMSPVLGIFGNNNYQQIYASSGTAKMLCAIAREMGMEAGVINSKALRRLRKTIFNWENIKDIELKGLKPNRQDLLLPGLAIMTAIIDCLGHQRILFSPTAMREGMLQEMLLQQPPIRSAEIIGITR